jgi:hypothetical protein
MTNLSDSQILSIRRKIERGDWLGPFWMHQEVALKIRLRAVNDRDAAGRPGDVSVLGDSKGAISITCRTNNFFQGDLNFTNKRRENKNIDFCASLRIKWIQTEISQ